MSKVSKELIEFKKLVEERYFISDIDNKYIEQLAKVIRSEWHIENNLHWVLDMCCLTRKIQKNLLHVIKKPLGSIPRGFY